MKWGWLILKLVLIAICGFGGYLIAVSLNNESITRFNWAVPWAGVLGGIIVGIGGLSIEKLVNICL